MSDENIIKNYEASTHRIAAIGVEKDLDLHTVSRRELQYLAKELQLCRANVKSEVIVSFLEEFIQKESEGKEKIMFLLDTMPEEAKMIARTPLMSAKPATRSKELRNDYHKVLITPRAMDFSDINLSTEPLTPLRRSTRQASLLSQQRMTRMDSRSREDHYHAFPQLTPISRRISFGTEPPTPDINVIDPPRFDENRIGNIQIQDVVDQRREEEQTHPEAYLESSHEEEWIEHRDHETLGQQREYQEEYPEQLGAELCEGQDESYEQTTTKNQDKDNAHSVEQIQTPRRKPLASIENKAALNTFKNDVKALVDSMDDLSFLDNGKVRCLSTGHEMKADSDVILSYISGKKYYRAKALHMSFDSYAPMFVDHPDPSQVSLCTSYCCL
jgi:hypothetical protein